MGVRVVRVNVQPPTPGRRVNVALLCALTLCAVFVAGVAASETGAAPSVEAPAAPGSAAPAEGDDEDIEEMVVTATRVERGVLELPIAVSVVTQDEIQAARRQLTLAESLSMVPGVFVQNRTNFAQDTRISIRGFGARSRFGIRGIKLIVDGVPSTLPDGQGQVDSLQLASAGRIEVIRGPTASLYGSASGGVIRIESERPSGAPFVDGRVSFGSNGFQSYEALSAGRVDSVGYLVGLTRQVVDGYRDQSRMESNVLNSRVAWEIDEDSELDATLSFVYAPIADDPGGLTLAEVDADRRMARDRNVTYDAGERVNQTSVGARYRHRFGAKHQTTAATYFGFRDFSNELPFAGECTATGPPAGARTDLDRFYAGGSVQHEYDDEFFGLPNQLLVGFDVEAQRDDRLRRCDYATWVANRTLDQDEDVTSVRGFFQDELDLPLGFRLTASLGYDALFYAVDDQLAVTPGDPDDSDDMTFTQWSPMGGVSWGLDRRFNAYGRISTSFEPPSTTELRRVNGGGFDTSLEAQRAVNYEVGVKGILPARLRYELAGYYIAIDDELIPYTQSGDVFYRNAGETYRAGLELGLRYALTDWLDLAASYTFTHAEFLDYVTASGADLAGNLIPGIPQQVLAAEVVVEHPTGLFAGLEVRYAGPFYADDANAVEIDASVVADLRLGWRARLGRITVTPHFGINNLSGREYFDNVRLNESASGRFYEPAPVAEFYGGIGVSYAFGATE